MGIRLFGVFLAMPANPALGTLPAVTKSTEESGGCLSSLRLEFADRALSNLRLCKQSAQDRR